MRRRETENISNISLGIYLTLELLQTKKRPFRTDTRAKWESNFHSDHFGNFSFSLLHFFLCHQLKNLATKRVLKTKQCLCLFMLFTGALFRRQTSTDENRTLPCANFSPFSSFLCLNKYVGQLKLMFVFNSVSTVLYLC